MWHWFCLGVLTTGFAYAFVSVYVLGIFDQAVGPDISFRLLLWAAFLMTVAAALGFICGIHRNSRATSPVPSLRARGWSFALGMMVAGGAGGLFLFVPSVNDTGLYGSTALFFIGGFVAGYVGVPILNAVLRADETAR